MSDLSIRLMQEQISREPFNSLLYWVIRLRVTHRAYFAVCLKTFYNCRLGSIRYDIYYAPPDYKAHFRYICDTLRVKMEVLRSNPDIKGEVTW